MFLGITFTQPFQSGAAAGVDGKGLICGLLAGTWVASLHSVDAVLLLFGMGSGGSLGSSMCHSPSRHLKSWLSCGTLYRCSAEFCKSMFSLTSMGKIASSWCKGSQGVVQNVPKMILTASFRTVWSFLMSVFCLPVNHIWHP